MICFLDLETLPSLAPDAKDQVRKTLKPPGTLKKAESIAAWWENEADAAAEEAWRRQALDGAAGELCAIGFAPLVGDPVSIVRDQTMTERQFLVVGLNAINVMLTIPIHDGETVDDPHFVCHNAAFDLGFLLRRCWALGIKPPFRIPAPLDRRGFTCTSELWAGYKDRISLDRLCKALGIKSPKEEGVDGSQVYDLWMAGKYDEIRDYNCRDVEATRAVWKRLNWID
jgi:3'-5' exonuclease